MNGDAKETLDFIDIQQMVYGVKVDGADYPEWKDTALKNDYLRDGILLPCKVW